MNKISLLTAALLLIHVVSLNAFFFGDDFGFDSIDFLPAVPIGKPVVAVFDADENEDDYDDNGKTTKKRQSSRSRSVSTVDLNLDVVRTANFESSEQQKSSTPKCGYESYFLPDNSHIFNCSCLHASYCSYKNIVPVSDDLDRSCWFPLASHAYVESVGVCKRLKSLEEFKRPKSLPLRLIYFDDNYYLDFGCTKFVTLKKSYFVDIETCSGELPYRVEKDKSAEKARKLSFDGAASVSKDYRKALPLKLKTYQDDSEKRRKKYRKGY